MTPDAISPGQVWNLPGMGEVLIQSLKRPVESYNPETNISTEQDRVEVRYSQEWDPVLGAPDGDEVLSFASIVWDEGEYVRDAEIWDPMDDDDWEDGIPDDSALSDTDEDQEDYE